MITFFNIHLQYAVIVSKFWLINLLCFNIFDIKKVFLVIYLKKKYVNYIHLIVTKLIDITCIDIQILKNNIVIC